jgi:hypothetical protein
MLKISLGAFDVGCKAIGYGPTEWHHVGRYANQVDYYDLPYIQSQVEFWRAVMRCYKQNAKRLEIAIIIRDLESGVEQ